MNTYTFITDQEHGWLKVSIDELKKLGIAKHISNYSYMDLDSAFLEEDRDALLFIAKVSKINLSLPNSRELLSDWCAKHTKEIYEDNQYYIRGLERFHSNPDFWLN